MSAEIKGNWGCDVLYMSNYRICSNPIILKETDSEYGFYFKHEDEHSSSFISFSLNRYTGQFSGSSDVTVKNDPRIKWRYRTHMLNFQCKKAEPQF